MFSNFYFLVGRWLGAHRQKRPELTGGQVVERAEPAAELDGGQAALAVAHIENPTSKGCAAPLLIAVPGSQNEASFLIFLNESFHRGKRGSQETLYLPGRAISRTNPNEFRRRTQENTAPFKVRILRDDGETVAFCIFPYRRIVCATQSTLLNMGRTGIQIGQLLDQLRRKIFIEKKLHAFSISDLRSRSAANARHARISCSVK